MTAHCAMEGYGSVMAAASGEARRGSGGLGGFLVVWRLGRGGLERACLRMFPFPVLSRLQPIVSWGWSCVLTLLTGQLALHVKVPAWPLHIFLTRQSERETQAVRGPSVPALHQNRGMEQRKRKKAVPAHLSAIQTLHLRLAHASNPDCEKSKSHRLVS